MAESLSRLPSVQEFSTPMGNTLRIFRPEDSFAIFSLIDRNREHLSQHGDITSDKYPTEKSVLDSIVNPPNPDKLRYGVWNPEGIFVGTINFTPDKDYSTSGEIGCYTGKEFANKGYATDAVVALTEFCINHGYSNPYAKVQKDNLASQRVLQKAGYTTDSIVDDKGDIKFSMVKK